MFKIRELLKATGGRFINGDKHAGVKGISIDSRTIKPGEAFLAIKGGNFDGHDFIAEVNRKGAACIIVEFKQLSRCAALAGRCRINEAWRKAQNTKPVTIIGVKDTIKALGDIARFYRRRFDIPVIAVTGSNGKTTAKDMIAWVLSGDFKVLKNSGTKNNHIGMPMTLLNLNKSYDCAVLELGTNHFGEIDYLSKIAQANIGIILNIGPAHLEHFKDSGGVLKEKSSLIKNLEKPRIAILNADDGLLKSYLFKSRSVVSFGFAIRAKADFCASKLERTRQAIGFSVGGKFKFTIKTLGVYNVYNALAAIAVARIFGISYSAIAKRLSSFSFPRSRLELIRQGRINFIDDTYNSNPVSVGQALDALDSFQTPGRKIFVMGDMLELGRQKAKFHSRIGRQIAKICDCLITVGELSKLAAEEAIARGFDVKNLYVCRSTEEAKKILHQDLSLRRDDIVLVKGSRSMKMEEVFS